MSHSLAFGRSVFFWMFWAALCIVPQLAGETVLHNFVPPPKGSIPDGGIVRDPAGNLYGTTHEGGSAGGGVVFKITPSGHQTVLHNFTGGSDGGSPYGGVIRDAAGNLYGTTAVGGSADWGTVFKIDTAGNETVLYNFQGGADGGFPYAGVIRDSAGNLYGTAQDGGNLTGCFGSGCGVVFKVDTAGHETVLYTFTGGADGANPYSGVIRDSAGNLYGVSTYGGSADSGVVYRVNRAGHETVLYSFSGGSDGRYPYSNVIRDSAGNLYGTTQVGGSSGAGVVYKLDPSGNETVLYNFSGGTDGWRPESPLIRDSSGNLYGTTFYGGDRSGCNGSGCGVLFEVDSTGRETVLYTFTGPSDGGNPRGNMARDPAGDIYGAARQGGLGDSGVVYKLNTVGQQTVLYSFPASKDGFQPNAGVIRDSGGNLYGTTLYGGSTRQGAVYKVTASGHEKLLYSFTGGADGGTPYAGVVRDAAGNLYGTTAFGGSGGAGAVYQVDKSGIETVLYNFGAGLDGGYPYAGVTRDAAGNLYGTTNGGGGMGVGVVYEVDTTGHETTLYSFTGGADGGQPYAGVIRDSAGNLYGTTQYGGSAGAGVVYKVDTSGQETVLYNFTGGADGGYPYAGVVRDGAGNLYGTTNAGGPGGSGAVYKIDPSGHETVLYSFTSGADGGYPYAGVVRDSAGNLYGTTQNGGSTGWGVVYKLDKAGHETVLYTFTGGPDGGEPYAGVIRDSTGNLYGTTPFGGSKQSGVVFRIP